MMLPSMHVLSLLSAVATVVYAHPLNHGHGSLLSSLGIKHWAQPADSPVAKLFARQATFDASKYPGEHPNAATMPDAWKKALADAVANNKIPKIVQSKDGIYPAGTNPGSKEICSSASQCRNEDGPLPDIWDSPDGMLGVSFDDGPTPASVKLYEFLESQNQKATHFFIGVNIRNNPDIFMQAFNQGNDIAIHTYTHRWMSSLSNEDLMADFGWCMQIIYDMTGGRIPRYWRPPYGDSDNRVRAIARLFGLQQVDWNQDTDDWEMSTGKLTLNQVSESLKKFINGPKSPGLMILEHELYPSTVQAFIDAYPLMKSAGWDTRSVPDLFGVPYYQNAPDNTGAVTPSTILSGVVDGVASPNSTTSASGTSSQGVTATGTVKPSASAVGLSNTGSSNGTSNSSSQSSSQNGALAVAAGPIGVLASVLGAFVVPFLL